MTHRLKVILAFAAVYLIWGSTYLGIKIGLESMPPFLMSGFRFSVAGLLLWLWCDFRKEPRPTKGQWKNATVVGMLLIVIGIGTVTWAEQTLPSGLAALLVAIQPVWIVLLTWGRRDRKRTGITLAGLVLGLAGVATLAIGPAMRGGGSLIGAIVVVIGTVAWSLGSLRSQVADMPASALRSNAIQMFTGGMVLGLLGLIQGELGRTHLGSMTAASAGALVYLILFGSLIAYSAYAWLLQQVSATAASTPAYVNPAVAVGLGVAFGEPMDPKIFAAMAAIFIAVTLLAKSGKAVAIVEGEVDLLEPRTVVKGRSGSVSLK